MKLSELSTDRALDALCELAPYVSNIASDKDITGKLGEMVDLKEMNVWGGIAVLAGRAGELAPALLKTHRPDVYGILSVMNERTVKEIAAQKLIDTMRQVKELFQDEEFMGFFKSSAQEAQSEPSVPSASAPA